MQQVEGPRRDEHEKHRLARDLEGDGQQVPFLLRGQLVRAFLLKSCAGLVFTETGEATEIQNGAGDRGLLGECRIRVAFWLVQGPSW